MVSSRSDGSAGTVPIRCDHRDLAQRLEPFGKDADTRGIHAIIVAYEYAHRIPWDEPASPRRAGLILSSLPERADRFTADDMA